MKKISKITLLIFLYTSLLLLIGLTGCSNEQQTKGPVEVVVDSEEETAKKAEEETIKKAEEEAAKKAEEEAAKKAEKEVAKKAEEEAAKKAEEEAAKKAEEEAAKKAEEEAAKKAEEEAAKKAEEEAAKKAEEEAAKKAEEEAAKKAEEEKLAKQMNSFSIMYYLAITAEDIRTSKNNRLILDEIYSSLLNDINPSVVDEITQEHLQNLRDVIKSYININTKRERLQFIHNQNKATAIRSAVPDPLAILSMTKSIDWRKFAINVAYTTVDSYTNYKNTSENADTEFVMSGWELDDEELATIQKNRDRAFDYMVDMVQEYELDGKLTLNEKAIQKYAEICEIESIPERIRRLTSEEGTYGLLGCYWLELADCYFDNSQYDKCLECVDKYQELSMGIFRTDYNYSQILPKAIVAAQNTYSGKQYESVISNFAEDLLENTEKASEYWSTRYFVAQVYLDLYSRTNKQQYIDEAFDIAYDNVTFLLGEQRKLNEDYLNDVEEVIVNEPDYRYLTDEEKKEKRKLYSEEKKRVKEYNKSLVEARKVELPSIYEPLVLNCELLFALADEKNVSAEERANIDAILQTSSNGIFMSKPINDIYSFANDSNKYSATVTKDEIIIPADLLTARAKILLTVTDNNTTETFTDCQIKKVERNGNDIQSFSTYVTSEKMRKYEWSNDTNLFITIKYEDVYDKEITLKYYVKEYEKRLFGDKVVLEQE